MDTSRAPLSFNTDAVARAQMRKKSPSVLTVSPDGSQDYTTIADAIAAAQAIATLANPVLIQVMPGVARYAGVIPAYVTVQYVSDVASTPMLDE